MVPTHPPVVLVKRIGEVPIGNERLATQLVCSVLITLRVLVRREPLYYVRRGGNDVSSNLRPSA